MIKAIYQYGSNQLVARLTSELDEEVQPSTDDFTVAVGGQATCVEHVCLFSEKGCGWLLFIVSSKASVGDSLEVLYRPREFFIYDSEGEEVLPFKGATDLAAFPENFDTSLFAERFDQMGAGTEESSGYEVTARSSLDPQGYLVVRVQPNIDQACRDIEEDYRARILETGKSLTIASVEVNRRESTVSVLVSQRLDGLQGTIQLDYVGSYSSLLVNGGEPVMPFSVLYPLSSPATQNSVSNLRPTESISAEERPGGGFKLNNTLLISGLALSAILLAAVAGIWMMGGNSETDRADGVPLQTSAAKNDSSSDKGSSVQSGSVNQVLSAPKDCQMKVPSGAFFTGQCVNGNPGGHGKLRWPNGASYSGDIKRGEPDGLGKITYPSGDIYEGAFKAGEKHGYGKMRWVSGAMHEGEYIEGKRHGYGIYRYSDGRRYEGIFNNGRFTQQGDCYPLKGQPYQGKC